MRLNFTMSELLHSDIAEKYNICNIPDKQSLDNLLLLIVNCLQPLREYIGKPMIISSGYRSTRLNGHPLINGSQTSDHVKGCAADFTVKGLTPKQIIDMVIVSGIPFKQVINEHNLWVHISYKEGENRKQVLYIQ